MNRILAVFDVRDGMEGLGDMFRIVCVFLFLVALIVFASFFGKLNRNQEWQKETVKRGCAEYDQTTGEWQWKEIAK